MEAFLILIILNANIFSVIRYKHLTISLRLQFKHGEGKEPAPHKKEPDHNVISRKSDFGFSPMSNGEAFKYFMQGLLIRLVFLKYHFGCSMKR